MIIRHCLPSGRLPSGYRHDTSGGDKRGTDLTIVSEIDARAITPRSGDRPPDRHDERSGHRPFPRHPTVRAQVPGERVGQPSAGECG